MEEYIQWLQNLAYEELIKEGLLRREGEQIIWTQEGMIEAMKLWILWQGRLDFKEENIRHRKYTKAELDEQNK